MTTVDLDIDQISGRSLHDGVTGKVLNSMKRKLEGPTNEAQPMEVEATLPSIFSKDYNITKLGYRWNLHCGSLMLCHKSEGCFTSTKVAAFDLDNTLIRTKSNAIFAKNEGDWSFTYPEIPKQLEFLRNSGFVIVIVTNQAQLSTNSNLAEIFKRKVVAITRKISQSEPIWLISTKNDQFRKPMISSWHYFKQHINQGKEIDYSASFFVGDAAGRFKSPVIKRTRADFSDTDRKFAINAGLPFFTPEEYFKLQPPSSTFTLGGCSSYAHALLQTKHFPEILLERIKKFLEKSDNEVVILVGRPASGKSSFYRKWFEPLGYIHINQDKLKTRDKCVSQAEIALENKKSVVIDNTNPDKSTRELYLRLAKKYGYRCTCVWFTTSENIAMHNNLVRTYSRYMMPKVVDEKEEEENSIKLIPKVAYANFTKRFQEPEMSEGFEEILQVDFIPTFEEPEQEVKRKCWEMWYA